LTNKGPTIMHYLMSKDEELQAKKPLRTNGQNKSSCVNLGEKRREDRGTSGVSDTDNNIVIIPQAADGKEGATRMKERKSAVSM